MPDLRLAAIIEKHGSTYLAYCPQLAGCRVSGASYEEALASLQEAVQFHLADRQARGERLPDAEQVHLTTLDVTVEALAPMTDRDTGDAPNRRDSASPKEAPLTLPANHKFATPPAQSRAPQKTNHPATSGNHPATYPEKPVERKVEKKKEPARKPALPHQPANKSREKAVPERDWRAGEWVEIDGMPGVGKILEADAKRHQARVLLNNMEFRLAYKKLRPGAPAELPPPLPHTMVKVTGREPVCHEVDLHGMRVEEALAAVDRALDQAVVARLMSVKIIHGHGTGALRAAVRQMLQHHPHVSHYRFGSPLEGGLACTIAEVRAARP